ncbi:MAG: AAA family ATPase [Chloroflexi bacterium]|nr:AAA family ATPase [Chloroflexota bacterium]
MDIEKEAREFCDTVAAIRNEASRVFVGGEQLVEEVLIALVADGHVLLEGVPGLGKTLLVRTLGGVLDLSFNRIQFTPDLMPADITGTNVVIDGKDTGRSFHFQPGPIFANLVLADEINRATPKTQSALLEAMEEYHVTVMGALHPLPEPFMVLATQNPIEMEGTYPLPEAQVDRFFFKVLMEYPALSELVAIVDITTGEPVEKLEPQADAPGIMKMRALARKVPVAEHLKEYAARLVLASHPENPEAPVIVREFVRYGASPRAARALILGAKVKALLSGRFNVSHSDIEAIALPVLRHRILLNFRGEAEEVDTDNIVRELMKEIGSVLRS